MQAATRQVEHNSDSSIGHLIKEWRVTRGMSQFDLAARAGFSTRHVSFVETGRTQPSREALVVLAEALDVPLRERNRLLEAGGFARV
jgi:transcriptional regulator with XRE-family HTH domain